MQNALPESCSAQRLCYDRYATYSMRMAEQCFKKKDSNPPVCGVHNVPLVRKQLSNKMIAAGYKGFTILVCPISGAVLNEDTAAHP